MRWDQSDDQERRKRTAKKLGHLLRMVYQLCSPGGLRVQDTAEMLGVSTRTVFRLLNALEEAGVPYHYDELDRVHRARPGWRPENLVD